MNRIGSYALYYIRRVVDVIQCIIILCNGLHLPYHVASLFYRPKQVLHQFGDLEWRMWGDLPKARD